MKIKNLIHSNQIYALIAKGLEGSKAIIITAIIARAYTTHDLGIFSYILAIGSIIAVIAEFRLHSVVVREINTRAKPEPEILGSAMFVILLFAIIGSGLMIAIALHEKDPVTSLGLAIYGLSFVFKIPRPIKSYYTAHSQNSVNAKCEIIASSVTIFATLYLAINQYSLIWIVAVRVGDFFISSALSSCIFIFSKKIPPSASWKTAKYLTSQSAPLVLSGAAMILFQRIDLILVKYFLGASQAGLYTAAITVMSLFTIPPMVISESLAPQLFKNSSPQIKQRFCNILTSLGVFLSICMLATSLIAIDFLFGANYKEAVPPALILSASPLLIALGASTGQIIVSEHTQHLALVKCVAACLISVILNLALIPSAGLLGAATATVTGLLIANYVAHLFIPSYKNIFSMQNKSFLSLLILKKRDSK